jgi:hypothetical protein
MRKAEDAAATHARAALEQVDAATALITVGCQLRIPEDSEFGHWNWKYLALRAREEA